MSPYFPYLHQYELPPTRPLFFSLSRLCLIHIHSHLLSYLLMLSWFFDLFQPRWIRVAPHKLTRYVS
jgi:hypothetical protein